MSLESKHYLASPTEVEAITKAVLEARTTGGENRASYLKALVAKTRDNLGLPPRERHAPAGAPLSAEKRDEHLRALEAAHAEYYAIVDTTARAIVGKGDALNAATNFARTATSTVRSWIRVGGDIARIAPGKVTKAYLQTVARTSKKTSSRVLTNRVNKYADKFMLQVVKLGEADKEVAVVALDNIIAQLEAKRAALAAAPLHRGTVRAERRQHVSP